MSTLTQFETNTAASRTVVSKYLSPLRAAVDWTLSLIDEAAEARTEAVRRMRQTF